MMKYSKPIAVLIVALVIGSSYLFWQHDKPVGGMPKDERALLLAPGVVVADLGSGHMIDIDLPERECGKTYVIERSYDAITWQQIGKINFGTRADGTYDPKMERSCEKDYVDTTFAAGTSKLFYRYLLLDESGAAIKQSNPLQVPLEYWQNN